MIPDMQEDNPRKKAPLDLHLRVWDKKIARFIKERAKKNRRPLSTELSVLLEYAVAQHMQAEEIVNGQ